MNGAGLKLSLGPPELLLSWHGDKVLCSAVSGTEQNVLELNGENLNLLGG